MNSLLLLVPVAFLVSALLVRRLSNPESIWYVLDHPNHRSLHSRPTPRNGGLAILGGLLATWPVLLILDGTRRPQGWAYLASAWLFCVVVSLWNDRHEIQPARRFLLQAGIALYFLVMGNFSVTAIALPGLHPLPLQGGSVLFSMVCFVWMLNLYNFMDGMDGFAGGMGAFGFVFFAAFGFLAGHSHFGVVSLLIAAANLGFLTANFPPARIFMGDVGSVPMGFLVATFSFWGIRDAIFPFWVPFLVFSPFIVDATLTLFRRIFQGEKVWQAHRTHYYQKLVRIGWGHRRTVLWEYVLMLGAGCSALYMQFGASDRLGAWIFLAWGVLYGTLALLIDWFGGRTLRQQEG
ncbi:MAG: glycosyltransferase family 4 protein [Magnetococcus sp. DMHC-1]|nr:glycosyltransferase family 4 protein [Magnetococcales bacterium]